MPTKINFKMYKGATFNETIRWESSKKVYKLITNITQAAPCIITSAAHGIPNKWRIKLNNILGMVDLNSADTYYTATIPDINTIELNDINSVGFKPYISGGIIEYNQPVDLTGYIGRMQLRSSLASTDTLDEYTLANGNIQIDVTNSAISIVVPASTTSTYSFNTAVYSLELISGAGIVTQLISGNITLINEVTR